MTTKRADEIIESVSQAYDAIAFGFSETRGKVWGEFLDVHKSIHEGQNILDIGCGNGRFLQCMPDANVSYTGIDHSAKLLEKAQGYAKQFSRVSSRFDVGSVLKLPYKDNAYDVALCIAVLHHIPSHEYRKLAVSEIYRVLKPGGMLIISNWYLLHIWNHVIPQLVRRVRNPQLYRECSLRDYFISWHRHRDHAIFYRYYYAFRKKEMQKLLSDAGFTLRDTSISMSEPDWSGKRSKRNIIIRAQKKA